MSDNNKTKNDTIFNFITGIPFITAIIIALTILFIWKYVTPHYSYTINSTVLTKDSFIELNNGKLKFQLNANLFPEINKKITFQDNISEIELQKAMLRKENKLFEDYQANKHNKQNLFDLGIWYLFTSGVKNNLKQFIKDRESRLITSYYYLNNFTKIENNEPAINKLTNNIYELIKKNSYNNRAFYNNLTFKPSQNLNEEPAEDELTQEELFKKTYNEENTIENLQNYCAFLKNNTEKHKNARQLAYIIASNYCYKELEAADPKNNTYKEILADINQKLSSY